MSEPYDELHGEPRDDDVLGGLRDAWRALPTPDPEHGADDAESEAVVAWLCDAWGALEAPPLPAALPTLVRRAARPPRRVPRGAWLGLAAAAALALWILVARHAGDARDVDVALRPGAPAGDPSVSGSKDTPGPTSDDTDGLAPIEVTEITPERMELRSGPVRLVLLNEWTETSDADDQIGER